MKEYDRHTNDMRALRAAVLNGRPIPPAVEARLQARGIHVPAIEHRILHTEAFRT